MTDSRILTEKFTRADYMATQEGFPGELIDGELLKRPTPSLWHQSVLAQIAMQLHEIAGSHHGLIGPLDVVVDDWNVLQCDALVTCPDDPVGPETTIGRTPLLVVEVLSPSTAGRDRDVKTVLYLRVGVREVWLVDPDAGTIEVHTSSGVERHAGDSRASSAALPGFTLSWSDLAA